MSEIKAASKFGVQYLDRRYQEFFNHINHIFTELLRDVLKKEKNSGLHEKVSCFLFLLCYFWCTPVYFHVNPT